MYGLYRDQAFAVLGQHPAFIAAMAGGSVAGVLLGAVLLGVVSGAVLVPVTVALLLFSAIRVWLHGSPTSRA